MNWKLSLKAGVLLALLVSLLVSAPVGAQGELPPYPWTVYGQVTINGVLASSGTVVEARNPSSGIQCGQTSVTTGGNYVVDVEASGQTSGCFNDGSAVQFWVMFDGVFYEAQQNPATQTFLSGDVYQINLAVSTGPLTTCPDFVSPPAGVGIEDIQATSLHWGEQFGDPGWDLRFDRDVDGRVTIKDIMLVAKSWGPCP